MRRLKPVFLTLLLLLAAILFNSIGRAEGGAPPDPPCADALCLTPLPSPQVQDLQEGVQLTLESVSSMTPLGVF